MIEESGSPSDDLGEQRRQRIVERVRSIEAAALAGVAFGVLSLAGLWMLSDFPSLALPDDELTAWFDDAGNQARLITGLNLMSLSAVMLLWFIAVIRRRIGDQEDRFFATVFFGSTIALIAIRLAGGVALAAPAVAMTVLDASSVSPATASLSGGVGATFLLVVAPRLQAVVVLSTSTVIRHSGRFPRWLGLVGYVFGVVLFITPLVIRPIGVAFPLWVIVVSLAILVHREKVAEPNQRTAD